MSRLDAVVWLIVLVFVVNWPGTRLIIHAIGRLRRRKELAERLVPFRKSQSLADEVEQWLRSQ